MQQRCPQPAPLLLRLFSIPMTMMLVLVMTPGTLAQQPTQQEINLPALGHYAVVAGAIEGSDIIDYQVSGKRGQILSVDLNARPGSAYFNILPDSSETALFIGATEGEVADVSLPGPGDYRIRVYQMRSAARRGERSEFSLGVSLGAPEYADGLSGGPDYWQVNLEQGRGLNLRGGPSTRYASVGLLRAGTPLENRGCRMTGSERWCNIRAAGSGVTGWAAGQYLIEGPAPRPPASLPGGPQGAGRPFDATGYLTCGREGEALAQQCPFGVIREGPGNAGIWIATGSGERHILFEQGVPVAVTPAGDFSHDRDGDSTHIGVDGEGYVIPDAVVFGG